MRGTLIFLAVLLAVLGLDAGAQDAAKEAGKAGTTEAKATEKKPEAKGQKIQIIRLVGTADVLPAGKEEWVAAKEKMVREEGSVLFTGDESTCELEFSGDKVYSVLMIEALSEIRVAHALLEDDTLRTKIQMRTGQVRVDLRPTAFRSDMQITTPNATASVTGSGCRCGARGGRTSLRNLYGSSNLNGQACPVGQKTDVKAAGQKPSNPTQNLKSSAKANSAMKGTSGTEKSKAADQAEATTINAADRNRSAGNEFQKRNFFQTSKANRDTSTERVPDVDRPGP